jgi:hypothetical protein
MFHITTVETQHGVAELSTASIGRAVVLETIFLGPNRTSVEVNNTSPAMSYGRSLVFATALLSPLITGLSGAPGATTDFSGAWEMDSTRSETAQSTPPVGPVTLVIKQTPTEISIETRRGSQTETLVYKLDGSESKKPVQDNGPFEWRARWEGPKLVTQTHRSVNRTTVTIQETLAVDAKAKELTVDRTLTVQHGYTMRGAKNYSSGRDVFVRAR